MRHCHRPVRQHVRGIAEVQLDLAFFPKLGERLSEEDEQI